MLSFGKWLCCFGSLISTDEWSHMIFSGLSMSRRQVYEYIASATKFCNCLFLLRIGVLNPKCRAYTRNSFNSCGASSRFSSATFSERAKFGNKIIQMPGGLPGRGCWSFDLTGTLNQTVVWQRLFMDWTEWEALNVIECGSAPKPKISESQLPWLLLRTKHTGRQQYISLMEFTSYLRMYRCFHRTYATKNCLRSCTEKKWRWSEFYPPT